MPVHIFHKQVYVHTENTNSEAEAWVNSQDEDAAEFEVISS